jgi:hypothetical protein
VTGISFLSHRHWFPQSRATPKKATNFRRAFARAWISAGPPAVTRSALYFKLDWKAMASGRTEEIRKAIRGDKTGKFA